MAKNIYVNIINVIEDNFSYERVNYDSISGLDRKEYEDESN